MAPRNEKSQLKRPRGSLPEDATESKKPRRSDRLSQADCKTPVVGKQHLPSPVTRSADCSSTDRFKEPTETPGDDDDLSRKTEEPHQALSSPPQDTQPLSQFVDPFSALPDEVEDEVKEGVWGYLLPLDVKYGDGPLVLKRRSACPLTDALHAAASGDKAGEKDGKPAAIREADAYNRTKIKGVASGGYLIGRHPECDIVVAEGVVSNRHCLLFTETKVNDAVALVEDLSSNGTYVNEAIVGRNQRRELEDGDEIAVHGKARFVFRYPRNRQTSAFLQQYTLKEKLGKGHFAEVYLCVEKATGHPYAVKIFSKPGGVDDRSKTESLQQEIGVLMGVSHPNVMCLKDTFNERDRVYLVLELAPEGELFNLIVMKQKLNENEARKLFRQLFQGIRYLHERNIVHRDIKPENILIVDKDLSVKIADFGLAKIIGEESFTTTLCGTPSYVAPEILADSKQRQYTKAVDIWSLGVVLYICLCGFPPFSDELYSRDFPFTLSQQIRSGRFDYPSPYWDSVGDPALDLIDSMLMVDPTKRFTIDQCLSHPWLTNNMPGVNDSTGGLVGGIAGLEVDRRAPHRERTLLASLNSIEVTAQIPAGGDRSPVKVFTKNKHHITNAKKETAPSGQRSTREFMEMGGKGDQQLFPDESSSVYPMPAATSNRQPQLLFVDGSFEELAREMADYLKAEEAKQLLTQDPSKEEVLSKLVAASQALSTVPEKEYTAASNLMVHLVLQSADPKKHLPTLCNSFSKALSGSSVHGPGLSLNALTTVFNLLDQEDPIRARVFMEILKFLKAHSMFDTLRPYLDKLPEWIDSWGNGEEIERKIYDEVAQVALEAGEPGISYDFVLKALRTFDSDDREEVTSEEAQRLSLRAVKMAILSNTHFLFQDLRAIPSVQALNDSHPVYSQLLDIFAEQDLEDYNDFNDEHDGWLEKEKMDGDRLHRKMRLLTFASLAAATPSRELEYARIAKALQIPKENVEMWAIDVIRAGLVEGKLSQERQMFLVHKVTYRVFGQKQYQELATRVDHWRGTLRNVLEVLRLEQANAKAQREREAQELERKMAGVGVSQGRRQQQRERTDNDD
ncbi:hypothetical protein CP533_5779 [Ophiocordyceps camponoti-saundersi (nom. inval.)]|nr:hypothetical protein CP533_5779 [Ophiocordyceps camponoti-saundersi (nom. inval.)]